MKCPFCGHLESKVTDSRAATEGDVIRRRRECEKCERRFTTYERVEDALPLVVKKDGRREPWDRMKVLVGLRRACEKRPIAQEKLDEVVDAIERELSATGEREVASQAIGEQVMNHLRGLDDIAYVRFASVYRRFQDLSELRAELDRMTEAPAPAPKRGEA